MLKVTCEHLLIIKSFFLFHDLTPYLALKIKRTRFHFFFFNLKHLKLSIAREKKILLLEINFTRTSFVCTFTTTVEIYALMNC